MFGRGLLDSSSGEVFFLSDEGGETLTLIQSLPVCQQDSKYPKIWLKFGGQITNNPNVC